MADTAAAMCEHRTHNTLPALPHTETITRPLPMQHRCQYISAPIIYAPHHLRNMPRHVKPGIPNHVNKRCHTTTPRTLSHKERKPDFNTGMDEAQSTHSGPYHNPDIAYTCSSNTPVYTYDQSVHLQQPSSRDSTASATRSSVSDIAAKTTYTIYRRSSYQSRSILHLLTHDQLSISLPTTSTITVHPGLRHSHLNPNNLYPSPGIQTRTTHLAPLRRHRPGLLHKHIAPRIPNTLPQLLSTYANTKSGPGV
jgi:hypothetical protein